jgi:hypothetical protein
MVVIGMAPRGECTVDSMDDIGGDETDTYGATVRRTKYLVTELLLDTFEAQIDELTFIRRGEHDTVCTVGVGHNFVVAECGQGGERRGAL